MKAVKLGLTSGYFRAAISTLRITNEKHTKKLHVTQATRTNREATDFCATFCIKKATGGRYRRLYTAILRKVVGESACDNPERSCGLF